MTDWREDALCHRYRVPVGWFFTEGGYGKTYMALGYCRLCSVRTDCLNFALTNDLQGVWGGTTDKQRSRMRRPLRRVS